MADDRSALPSDAGVIVDRARMAATHTCATAEEAWTNYCAIAGERISLHQLRHTHALAGYRLSTRSTRRYLAAGGW
jgi:integrase